MTRQQRPSIIFLSETLTSPDVLDRVRIRLGFDGCVCSPCLPTTRGLALLWRNEVPVRLRHFSHNHINMEVGHVRSDELWRFTGIYGFAANDSRVRMWDLLRTLAAQTTLPWLVAGDFNEILTNSEKYGGLLRGASPMARFRSALVDSDLMDMGFVGSKFTWSNRYTKERLDRSCSTPSWKSLYPCSRTFILPPSTSDHNPLLIEVSTTSVPRSRGPRHFRFEEMWAQHEDSTMVIKKGWVVPSTGEPLSQVCRKIQSTGELLMEWHLSVFQQRQIEMKLVQQKLDVTMSTPYISDQYVEQAALQARFNELLSLDEAYWRQQSWVLWLKEGDRNSVFFH